eukprot:3435694-Amphidinium_carterae.1
MRPRSRSMHEAYKRFSEEFNGATLPLYKTHKVCEVSLARHQGYGVNVHRLRHNGKTAWDLALGSKRLCGLRVLQVMEQLIENPEWMPRLFDAAGNTVQFPPPLNSEVRNMMVQTQAAHTLAIKGILLLVVTYQHHISGLRPLRRGYMRTLSIQKQAGSALQWRRRHSPNSLSLPTAAKWCLSATAET